MMPTPRETENVSQLNEPSAHLWSTRLTVRMLLLVSSVSLLGGSAGAFLTFAGLMQAWSLPGSAEDPRLVPLYLGAALAALLAGLFFWWLFVLRPRRLTFDRGAWAGVVSSLVVHPLAWLFALGVPVLTGGTTPWGLPPAPSVLTVLMYAGGFALYSLILTGWFTALVGGLAGAGVILVVGLLEPVKDLH
jgi:hypothetical protein